MRKLSRKHALVLLGCAAALIGGVRLTQPPVAPLLWKVQFKGFVISKLGFAADGQSVVGYTSQGVYRWNAADGSQLGQRSFDFRINTSTLSPDGERVVGLVKDKIPSRVKVMLYDTRDGSIAQQWPFDSGLDSSHTYAHALISPDHRRVWMMEAPMSVIVPANKKRAQYAAALAALFDVSSKRALKSWRLRFANNGRIDGNSLVYFDDYGRSLFFSSDSQQLMRAVSSPDHNGQYDGSCEMRDLLDGQSIVLPNPSYKRSQTPVFWATPTLSSNGRLLAVVLSRLYIRNTSVIAGDTAAGTIFVWDVLARKLLWTYAAEKSFVFRLAFSSDGKKLAVGGTEPAGVKRRSRLMILNTADGTVRSRLTQLSPLDFWKPSPEPSIVLDDPGNSSRQSAEDTNFEEGQVNDVAWSPDSQTLAACYSDGSVKLWRVP